MLSQDSKCPKLVEKWYDFGQVSFTIEFFFSLLYILMQMSENANFDSEMQVIFFK